MSIEAVDSAIRKLLEEHSSYPFLFLREQTPQGRLAELIRLELGERPENPGRGLDAMHLTQAHIASNSKRKWIGLTREKAQIVSRVQLEMKVSKDNSTPRKIGAKVYAEEPKNCSTINDLVVLRRGGEPITLFCHPGSGAGDVVCKVGRNDVDAIIEIKSSPLFIKGQHNAYDRDLEKLLTIKRWEGDIQCFFVYFDKSSTLYSDGNPAAEWGGTVMRKLRNRFIEEGCADEGRLHYREHGEYRPQNIGAHQGRTMGVTIQNRERLAKGSRGVHIYSLARVDNRWLPRLRVAFESR